MRLFFYLFAEKKRFAGHTYIIRNRESLLPTALRRRQKRRPTFTPPSDDSKFTPTYMPNTSLR